MFGQQMTRLFMLTMLLNVLVQCLELQKMEQPWISFFFFLKNYLQKLSKKQTRMLNSEFEQSQSQGGKRQHVKKCMLSLH